MKTCQHPYTLLANWRAVQRYSAVSVQISGAAGKVVHPLRSVLAKPGPSSRRRYRGHGRWHRPSSSVKGWGRSQRGTDRQKWLRLTRLVPLLNKYSLLWTKPRLLQRDVIVQVGKLPSGKVGDEFEAFIRVTFELDVSYQGLEEKE